MKSTAKWFRVALTPALLLVVLPVFFVLGSCHKEPETLYYQNQSSEQPGAMRSPAEAINMAMDAYWTFNVDSGQRVNTRSTQGAIIDVQNPLVAVGKSRARSLSGADTLLYIVNYANDGGYAIIAAPRKANGVLAVIDRGHYIKSEESGIPGFDQWMEEAIEYASSFVNETNPGDDVYASPDTMIHTINPDKPITRDTTLLTQKKEWEDTISRLIVPYQLKNNWGQSASWKSLNFSDCEGNLFSNGLCGCGPLAIAEVCLLMKSPEYISSNVTGGQRYNLDWDKISLHKKEYAIYPFYRELEDADHQSETHDMIAVLCRSIAWWGSATEEKTSTGMTANKIKDVSLMLFGKKVVNPDWQGLSLNDILFSGEVYLMIGDGESGHAWVCDGMRQYKIAHYVAIKNNETVGWETVSTTYATVTFRHYNWGWNGSRNGWFAGLAVQTGSNSYSNLRYLKIKL